MVFQKKGPKLPDIIDLLAVIRHWKARWTMSFELFFLWCVPCSRPLEYKYVTMTRNVNTQGERATGYGVALLNTLFGSSSSSSLLQAVSPAVSHNGDMDNGWADLVFFSSFPLAPSNLGKIFPLAFYHRSKTFFYLMHGFCLKIACNLSLSTSLGTLVNLQNLRRWSTSKLKSVQCTVQSTMFSRVYTVHYTLE